MKREGDNSSDRSGDITPSDSGRGGSEDDLNTSILLSHCSSIDFGKYMIYIYRINIIDASE